MFIHYLYLHIHLTEVAVAVLNHVCMLGAVKHRNWPLVALRSDVIVSRVNGDCCQVHK